MAKIKTVIMSIMAIVIVTLSSALLSGCTKSEQTVEKYDTLISSAQSQYDAKQYADSLKLYLDATSQISDRPEAYLGIVKILIDKNLLQKAEEIADIASNKGLNTESSQMYADISKSYFSQGSNEQTINFASKSLKNNSENDDAKILLARSYMLQGDTQKAKDYLDVSTTDKNIWFEARLLDSYTKGINLSDIAEAISSVTVDSTDVSKLQTQYNNLTQTLDRVKNYQEDNLFVSTAISGVYINAGYPKLAVDILQPLRDSMGEYWDGLFFLGKAYLDYGDYNKAIDVLNEATSLNPSSDELYLHLARAYYMSDQTESAIQNYEKAISLASEDLKLSYRKELFDALYTANQGTKAISVLDSIAQTGDSVWLKLSYCKQYLKDKNYQKLKDNLDGLTVQTSMTDEEKSQYYNYYLEYAFGINNIDLAQSLLESYASLDGPKPWVQYYYGKYYLAKGDTQTATTYLEDAIEFDLQGEVTDNANKLLAIN